MAVGLLALGVAHLLDQRRPRARALAIGWNVLGLLNFATAFATAFAADFVYLGPFATRLAAFGVSLLYLNYVLLIPSFIVPLFSLLHVFSLFQILSPGQRAQAAEHHPRSEGPRLTA
jgi:hypothetical protein